MTVYGIVTSSKCCVCAGSLPEVLVIQRILPSDLAMRALGVLPYDNLASEQVSRETL